MKTRYDITQRTDEWHEVKWTKIGGTRCGTQPKTLKPEILAELTEGFIEAEDGFTSSAMLRGIELEPLARERLEAELFIEFKDCGWIESEDNDWLGLSPDGITADEKTMCEIKCPSAKKHMETMLHGGVLPEYVDQLIHAFVVNDKLERHYFCSFRPENTKKPLIIIELTKESEVNIGTIARPVMSKIGIAVENRKESWKAFRLDVEQTLETL